MFHDFRVVYGKNHINLIFDLVVPREYNEAVQETLKTKISAMVQEKDPRCDCVITAESSFMAEE